MALVAILGAGALLGGAIGRGLLFGAAFFQVYRPLSDPQAATGQPGAQQLFLRGAGRETVVAMAMAAATLPPWAAACWWWLGPLHVAWPSSVAQAAGALAWAMAVQVAQVAAAEEWFWRGYVQPSLGGGRLALLETACAFGLAHVAFASTPLAAATAVPGLLFGALAQRRGGLLGATLLHAAYNVASAWLLFTPLR